MLQLFFLIMTSSLLGYTSGELEECEEETNLNFTDVVIQNLTESANFDLYEGTDSMSNRSLTITFSWDLLINTTDENPVDGFLYCFSPADGEKIELPDEESNVNYDDRPLSEETKRQLDGMLEVCKFYIEKPYWVTDQNGTYRSCRFPCVEFVDCIQFFGVCYKLAEMNCRPLDKHRRSVTLPAQFGKRYIFNIFTYKGQAFRDTVLDVLIARKNILNAVIVYCGHHLIENENIPQSVAVEYCEMNHPITALTIFSGPVSNFTIVNEFFNFDANETVIVISWSPPHDTHQEKEITEYNIFTNISSLSKNVVRADNKTRTYYHTIRLRGVPYDRNIPIIISITPIHRSCYDCLHKGRILEVELEMKAYDPCLDRGNSSFCVLEANCSAFSNPASYTDWCQCYPGYAGNGVNKPIMASATGCSDFDACSSSDQCVRSATCVDARPPSITVQQCHCPTFYFGDGKVTGTGCKPYGAIPVVLVPLFVFVVVCLMLLYRRRQRIKLLHATLSRFVSKNSCSYSTAPFLFSDDLSRYISSISNHNDQVEPVFGNKLEIDRKALVMEDVIGRGNFGVVHKAILTRDGDEKVVAVKSLTGAFSYEYRNEFLAEISLLLHLGEHENILGVIGVCTVQDLDHPDDEQTSPLLVTEFMVYGDLLHFLWNARDTTFAQENPIYDFSEESLFNIGRQVAHGLQFVSQSRVIHGDVAARNILVGENLQVKISDFGLANDVYRYGLIKGTMEKKVPFKWVSPERMAGGANPITWKSDVWSFGILLYEMVTLGASPYPGMDPVTIYTKLRNGYRMPQPSSCSNYLYEIMKTCWQWEATKRPGFTDLEQKLRLDQSDAKSRLSHPILTRIDHLNDINPESYDRVVERRDSTLLTVETSLPSDGTSSHCHDSTHDLSRDVIARNGAVNGSVMHDVAQNDVSINLHSENPKDLANGETNGTFVTS